MNFKLAVEYFGDMGFSDFSASFTYEIEFMANLETDYCI